MTYPAASSNLMQDGGGNGNGHRAPVSSPGGTGAVPPPANGNGHAKQVLPPALEANKYPKGKSGNPAGRPKGSVSAPNAIHAILSAKTSKHSRMSHLEDFMQIAKARSRKGDHVLTCAILNKWAPDLRIPDVESGGGSGGNVNLTLNAFERALQESAPTPASDRPTFEEPE